MSCRQVEISGFSVKAFVIARSLQKLLWAVRFSQLVQWSPHTLLLVYSKRKRSKLSQSVVLAVHMLEAVHVAELHLSSDRWPRQYMYRSGPDYWSSFLWSELRRTEYVQTWNWTPSNDGHLMNLSGDFELGPDASHAQSDSLDIHEEPCGPEKNVLSVLPGTIPHRLEAANRAVPSSCGTARYPSDRKTSWLNGRCHYHQSFAEILAADE